MERKGLVQQDVVFPSETNRESAGPFIGKQKEEGQARNRKDATLCVGGDRNGQELPETPLNQDDEGRSYGSYQKLLSIKTMKAGVTGVTRNSSQ